MPVAGAPTPLLLTTGDADEVNRTARLFWPEVPAFQALAH
jgi:hypothetical protein